MPVKTVKIGFKPTPKQKPFVDSTAMFKLGGGARGGGKSAVLCNIAFLLSFHYPGNVGYAGRAQLTDFERSTLPLLLQAIPPELLVTHNQNKRYLDILSKDGVTVSRIWYGPMENPGELLGGDFGWFFIDEAYQVPQETFVNLAGNLRGSLPDGSIRPFFGLLATNPAPGWLADTFPVYEEEYAAYQEAIKREGPNFQPFPSPVVEGKHIDPDYQYFPFRASDNPYNGPGYEERLIKQYAKLGPEWVSRMVYGVWDATMEGLVYQLKDENLWHSRTGNGRLYRPGVPVELAGDPSNGAGVYAVAVLQRFKGHVLQVDEFYREGGTDEDFRDWLKAQPYSDDVADGVFDHAKPDSVKRIRSWGYWVHGLRKKKNITDQINAVKVNLAVDPLSGRSVYIIDARQCPNTVQEFRKRVYKPRSSRNPDLRRAEQPVKANDHIINAVEYWFYEKLPFGNEPEPEKQDPAYTARAYMRLLD